MRREINKQTCSLEVKSPRSTPSAGAARAAAAATSATKRGGVCGAASAMAAEAELKSELKYLKMTTKKGEGAHQRQRGGGSLRIFLIK